MLGVREEEEKFHLSFSILLINCVITRIGKSALGLEIKWTST